MKDTENLNLREELRQANERLRELSDEHVEEKPENEPEEVGEDAVRKRLWRLCKKTKSGLLDMYKCGIRHAFYFWPVALDNLS